MPCNVVPKPTLNSVKSILSIIMVMIMVTMVMLMTVTNIVTISTIIDCQDDYTTINLNHGYGNDIDFNNLQDVDISKGVKRGSDYDNDDKINDNGNVHIDL